MAWWGRNQYQGREIMPEDIFLDASNRAGHNEYQLEGRIERPVSPIAITTVGVVFSIAALIYAGQAFNLQIVQGTTYADISRNNRLDRSVLFASRGLMYDRNGVELAWNAPQVASSSASTTLPFAKRRYTDMPGFAHVLGFVRYPKADSAGSWWREEYSGVAGLELVYDSVLAGKNGSTMYETNARGVLVREDIVDPPKPGRSITLSLDAEIQSELSRILSNHAEKMRFEGGAALIMDVHTGELIAVTSFPEYDTAAFAEGNSEVVNKANNDPVSSLLNRAIAGLYTPGSIVKPMFAAAALHENLIDPEKEILSTGSISIPNPYFPDKPSIFKDWKAHGYVDMRRALAVSSDVYFYAIGGGYKDQKGLGIEKINSYARSFGFGEVAPFPINGGQAGVIPTPEWKEKVFEDPWRLGDTYNTAIGQYGFQVTPLQVIRFVAAVANGGTLLDPHLIANELTSGKPVGVTDEELQIVREGMRQAVTEGGTAASLNMGGIEIAGKTGTAQTGTRNQYMNSWVIGFWPYSNPKYAFAVVLEKAPANTLSGAAPALSTFFYWLRENKPEYLE